MNAERQRRLSALGEGAGDAKVRSARGAVVATVVAATLIHVAVNGYAFGGCTEKLLEASPSGDHANILPWVHWYQDHSLYSHDYQIAMGASYATVLWPLVAVMARVVPLEYVFFFCYLTAVALTYWMLFRMGRLVGRSDWAGIVACVLFVAAKNAPAGEATHDAALYTRVAALPLVLMAVEGSMAGRGVVAFGALLVAVAVHSLTAFYAMPVVILIWLLQLDRTWAVRALWPIGCLAGSALIVLALGGGHTTLGQPTDEWIALQRGNNLMHLFPSEWGRGAWRDAGLAWLFMLGGLLSRDSRDGRRLGLCIVIAAAGASFVGWVFAEKWPSMLLMQLQPLRALKVYMILAIVLGAARFASARTPMAQLVAAGCIVAWLAGSSRMLSADWLNGVAWVFVALMVLSMVLERFRVGSPRNGANYGPRFIVGGTGLVAVFLFIALPLRRIDHPRSGQRTARYGPNLDLPWRTSAGLWIDVQRWIDAHTQTDAHFITPPILEGFRTYARRSEFVDWKQGTLSIFHEDFGVEWERRLLLIAGRSGLRRADQDLYVSFNAIDAAEFQALAARFGLTHAVTMKPVAGLTEMYTNGAFYVYRLR